MPQDTHTKNPFPGQKEKKSRNTEQNEIENEASSGNAMPYDFLIQMKSGHPDVCVFIFASLRQLAPIYCASLISNVVKLKRLHLQLMTESKFVKSKQMKNILWFAVPRKLCICSSQKGLMGSLCYVKQVRVCICCIRFHRNSTFHADALNPLTKRKCVLEGASDYEIKLVLQHSPPSLASCWCGVISWAGDAYLTEGFGTCMAERCSSKRQRAFKFIHMSDLKIRICRCIGVLVITLRSLS